MILGYQVVTNIYRHCLCHFKIISFLILIYHFKIISFLILFPIILNYVTQHCIAGAADLYIQSLSEAAANPGSKGSEGAQGREGPEP